VSTEHIINAWRDEEYHESLDADQRNKLPESPAGAIDLSENELTQAQGGSDSIIVCTFGDVCFVIQFALSQLGIHGFC